MKLHISHKTLPGTRIYAIGKTYVCVQLQILLQLELRLSGSDVVEVLKEIT
jgi:hypothetical protein